MSHPKPHKKNKKNIKAFILGCDPTVKDNKLEFEYVFDIENDKRYFAGILSNLKLIGLFLEDVYVQNLITEYQDEETSGNKNWNEIAKTYIPSRRKEFDKIDPEKKIPVFLTSEVLYKVLLNDDQNKYKAKELYNNKSLIPISAKDNQLKRPLITLYRHYSYSLSRQKEYLNYLLTLYSF